MKYDFIEIGTSDFKTLIENPNSGKGISVEPLKYYLNRLPSNPNVIKSNFAISDSDSEINIYWVTPENISKYNLPHWVRGCNSINAPHPTIKNLLKENHDSIVNVDVIKCITWSTFVKLYDIECIDFLKIDTEGHDAIILEEYFKLCDQIPSLLAPKILFENNVLSDSESINKVIDIAIQKGYKGEKLGDDYKLILS
jgi:FkbM family methyltransferase